MKLTQLTPFPGVHSQSPNSKAPLPNDTTHNTEIAAQPQATSGAFNTIEPAAE